MYLSIYFGILWFLLWVFYSSSMQILYMLNLYVFPTFLWCYKLFWFLNFVFQLFVARIQKNYYFRISTLCPAPLLNSFVSSRSIFCRFLGIFLSLVNRDKFISSFLICMPLISFSCLIALARTCSLKLNLRVLSASFLILGEIIQCFAIKYDRCSLSWQRVFKIGIHIWSEQLWDLQHFRK